MKVKLLTDVLGFKKNDIADVIKRDSLGYVVFVEGRESTSSLYPNVWYHDSDVQVIPEIKIIPEIKKVKLLSDSYGFKAGDIATVLGGESKGYIVSVKGRQSTSPVYAPNVWYRKGDVQVIDDAVWEILKDGRRGCYCDKCGAVVYLPKSKAEEIRMKGPCPICGDTEGYLWIVPETAFTPKKLEDLQKELKQEEREQKQTLLKALEDSGEKWRGKIKEMIRDTRDFPCPLCKVFLIRKCVGCPLNKNGDHNRECCKEWQAVRDAVNVMCDRIDEETRKVRKELEDE